MKQPDVMLVKARRFKAELDRICFDYDHTAFDNTISRLEQEASSIIKKEPGDHAEETTI